MQYPSYNTNKQFHPKTNGWVGYIFTAKGQRIYIAGDTDYIPEMKNFRVDIALLPVSGTYVMTAEEAVKAALDIKPKIAIPMHYGSIVGSKNDADRFCRGPERKDRGSNTSRRIVVQIDEIKRKIKGDLGKEILFYETTDSTNTIASNLAEKNAEGAGHPFG